ncbi:MAG: glycosyltransferase family 39 protein, partial [Polyangiaceae bacterium]
MSASPLAWVLLAMFVLHVIGIGWGMPASDGWEDDGIAPRDFLVGTHDTYLPGHFFTYPPVHLVTLTILTSPVSLYALAHAQSLSAADVVSEFIKVPYMTIFTLVARMVSVLMSLGIAYALAKAAEEIRGKRAGVFVAVVVGLNVPFTYYAHTSNLDVPYLFWASFALLGLVRVIARHDLRGLRRALVFAALAVGTKDQAYALFLLSVPLAIVLWLVIDPEARAKARSIVRELVIGGAIATGLLLLIDGAITNPSGFSQRIAFLLGPASQDHAFYPATLAGKVQIVKDIGGTFGQFYPWPIALLVVVGIAAHVAWTRRTPAKLVAGLLPLFVAISFTICFNFAARRSEHRFALPQLLLLGYYGGLGVEAILERCRTR